MIKTLLTLAVLIFSLSHVHAERIMGYKLGKNDIISISHEQSQLRLCADCEEKWHDNANDLELREYAEFIDWQKTFDLLLKRTHAELYVGLGVDTGTVYYINFGNIEGPFDDSENLEDLEVNTNE